MTQLDNETQETKGTAETGQQAPEPAAAQQESDSEAQQEPDPRNAEAAKWRHRAKDAQTGLDVARMLLDGQGQQIEALQRQVIGQHVAGTFASAEDFHRGVDLADLVDSETGSVDLGRVEEAAQRILTANPHYAKGRDAPASVPASVVTTNTPPTHVPGGEKPSWSDVLNEGKKLQ